MAEYGIYSYNVQPVLLPGSSWQCIMAIRQTMMAEQHALGSKKISKASPSR
jgi:hypothetical protein